MNGTSPSENTPNTSPMYLASCGVVLPCAKRNSHSGVPSAPRKTAAGTTITDATRTPVEKSSRTSEYLRSVAWPLIRGSSALITEMPTTAYGSWNNCQELKYVEYPAPTAPCAAAEFATRCTTRFAAHWEPT